MSKKKSKKNKSKKQKAGSKKSKSSASNKSTKIQSKIESAQKPGGKKPDKKPATNQSDAIKLTVGVLTAFFIVLSIGVAIGTKDDTNEQPTTPSNVNPNQTLKVAPPTGSPTPGAYDVQGSKPESQTTQGGLQEPATTDRLQPNAKIKDYENAILN